MKKFFFFISFFICSVDVFASDKLVNIQSFKIDNGLEFIVVPNNRTPVITYMVWYKVGSGDEIRGKSGLAHFTEHMMFRGSHNIPDGKFSEIITSFGGSNNAFTSKDYTVYYQEIAANYLELVMAMEAERMKGLVFSEKNFNAEKKVILEERLTSQDNRPLSQLLERMQAALWTDDANAVPVIGTYDDIKRIKLEDLHEFHTKWYSPNNAFVVITGDVDFQQVKKLADRYYSKIKAQKIEATNHKLVPQLFSAEIKMSHQQVKQAVLAQIYLIDSYGGDEKKALSFEVLSEIIGNYKVGRLFKSLVVDKKVASVVSAYYDGFKKDSAELLIYAYLNDGAKSLDELNRALDEEIRKIASGQITEAEVNSAIKRIISDSVYIKDKNIDLSLVLGRAAFVGKGFNLIENWAEKIATVTRDDVVNAAGLMVKQTPKAIGKLIPYEN